MCDLIKWRWLDYEKCNKKRLFWGAMFLFVGIVLLIAPVCRFDLIDKILKHFLNFLWVSGWSSIGIGAGLINRRIKGKDEKEGDREDQYSHYIIYYLIFAIFVSSLAAFALGRYENGTLNLPLSALIGLTIGFSSKRLEELTSIR